ncbi:MAG: 2-nonaprenyl-3-methyl-6-methoxy-1,4-benzoquinol hydroxylase [Alphaproteobacteria bacterium MarineAlpha10_Bin3]|mgnify:FL=1|nr:MAG: 2-nonaprenyl-3-methyl-6-methoxy-1,4-benzoquinol hydroxylase [Alphaproteobacteria bacterium MarineAlpha10_Bin3]PPR75428.1 MAG: 2-nonaprenyl-3-methyl-6-methoxy-1,4-benzoquinol hydroxylase [Alphaproteobacteria bacterium MarineAlpha4_Bin1]
MTETPGAGPAYLPGDRPADARAARIIRVDQAGEFGAVRIYAGQRAVLRRGKAAKAIEQMAAQEAVHLETFDRLIVERRVRPTALRPLWHVGGYAMGAATALLGEKAAMACTAAVEEVIDEHYAGQLAALGESDPELSGIIEEYRADEAAHRQTALDHGARDTLAYPVLTAAVKSASRLAIWLSERF